MPADPVPVQFGIIAGRVVAASRARELVSKLDLKQRLYLGPTALDAELALIMANAAGVREGCYSLDTFAGTGSILVACAALGGHKLSLRWNERWTSSPKSSGSTELRYEKETSFLPKQCLIKWV